MNRGQYRIEEIEFVVPDLETAERIFMRAMGLKIKYKGEISIQFILNEDTILLCSLPRKGIGLKGFDIDLFAPTQTILEVAEKLKNGPDDLDLRARDIDGKERRLLQIYTPGIRTCVLLSDKPRDIAPEGVV